MPTGCEESDVFAAGTSLLAVLTELTELMDSFGLCRENLFFGGFCRGIIMSHLGSRGLLPLEDLTGVNRTKVESSQLPRGE